MACIEPFAQITGTAKIYIAPKGEAPPSVSAGAPGGNWVYLGETEGEQSIEYSGALTTFRVNERSGPVKAVRPEEDVVVSATLVELTLENYAYVLSQVSNVTTSANPAAKRLANKRGFCPAEYALLVWGEADSPEGLYPGYNYLPRVVSDAEPTVTRARDGRAALEAMFRALEDYDQAAGDELGWAAVQVGA
jgi:hypothetical protein